MVRMVGTNTVYLQEQNLLNSNETEKNTLVDLKTVQIDTTAPEIIRAKQYLTQVKNPYKYRVGDITVNIEFTKGGGLLKELLRQYLTSLKEIA